MNKNPLIIDIKGNSLDDGPGIRSVVFFKGCPLDCVWCQNPEGKKTTVELYWDSEKCLSCGTCIELCPEKAISADYPFFVNRDRCKLCFKCTEKCIARALTRVGQEMTVEEIVQKIIRYKPFYEISGGGVTLSGGEPTLYMEFTSKLLQRLRAEGIHTLIETCGWFDLGRFENMILPFVDAIYMDIKIFDSEHHKHYCGVSNEKILNNFIHLNDKSHSGKFDLLPRIPLIPGITDTEENIFAISKFFNEHGIYETSLLSNNPLWFNKCEKLGFLSVFKNSGSIREFYDQKRLDRIKDVFISYSVNTVFS